MAKEDVAHRLLQLKRSIENAKNERAQVDGRYKEIMRQLATLGHETVEAAQTRIVELEAQVTKLDKQIEEGIRLLEEKIRANP